VANIFKSEILEKDLGDFIYSLNQQTISNHSIDSSSKPLIKKFHRNAYIIALLLNKLEKRHIDEHRFLFLSEVLSDLLSNIKLSIIGFKQSSLIITRRILENFYNHIYYFEHPVEYKLLNLGRNEYTPILELKSYLEAHPLFKTISDRNIKIFNDQVFQHYQELCRIVHTKGRNFMGLAKNLEDIRPGYILNDHIESINNTILVMVYLLFKFHRDLEFSNIEKSLISKTFPISLRGHLLS